ncbi:hypothetical protein K438DRAFT_1816817 [Mycena galopus ATCC 62051]|nr:hypothetical protein K438DRAFT_1816817 [Mycena galopus ATCC 62051]
MDRQPSHSEKTCDLRVTRSVSYITSWPSWGYYSNQVIKFMNLLYLALITERVPIMPRFVSKQRSVPDLDFGEVFNVPYLQRRMDLPILEWPHVKDPKSDVVDSLGCWNVPGLLGRHLDYIVHLPCLLNWACGRLSMTTLSRTPS